MNRPVVTIDGPAGAGKSSLAKILADRLGFLVLESGSLYRAVGLAALEAGLADDDEAGLAELIAGLDITARPGESSMRVFIGPREVTSELRREAVGAMASAVSKLAVVRRAMTDLQRRIGARGGVVVEGRDAGTVVFPSAEAKIYLEADLAERARRRVAQLAETGVKADLEQVIADMAARDEQDSSRQLAPLRAAEGAVVIDTTDLTPEEVLERMTELVKEIWEGMDR